MDTHHMRGTVGSGSANAVRVTLTTGDGNVRLKKA